MGNPGPLRRIGVLGLVLQNATHAKMTLLQNDTVIMAVAKCYICQNGSVSKCYMLRWGF
jgi:hypothetical protein